MITNTLDTCIYALPTRDMRAPARMNQALLLQWEWIHRPTSPQRNAPRERRTANRMRPRQISSQPGTRKTMNHRVTGVLRITQATYLIKNISGLAKIKSKFSLANVIKIITAIHSPVFDKSHMHGSADGSSSFYWPVFCPNQIKNHSGPKN